MPRKAALETATNEVNKNIPKHMLKAGENGTPIEEYAERLYASQNRDAPETYKLSQVERGLIAQKYGRDEVRDVVTGMLEAKGL